MTIGTGWTDLRAGGAPDSASNLAVDTILRGGVVVTMDPSRRVWSNGYVAIKAGAIVAVGDAAECAYVGTREISLAGRVLIPGLVNCHTHLSHGLYRGMLDEVPLAAWSAGGMWNLVRDSDFGSGYAGARVSLTENLRSGVTTVVAGEMSVPDVHAIDGVLRAVHESGSRAVVARMCADSADDSDPSQTMPEVVREDPETAVREVLRLKREFDGPLVEVVPEPLGLLRCTPDMVQALTDLARSEGSRMTMHVASSTDEVAEARRRYGMGCIEKLAELEVLGPNLLIAHCIEATAAELQLLADTSTGVSHNPVSNLMYGLGIAPLSEMIDAGVRVGLGTDGASTNNGQNLWETMKFAVFLQKSRFDARWGSAELALELATIGGARAIGMDDIIGSIEVGKRADLVVLDTSVAQVTPAATWVSNIVYSADRSIVRLVLVDGQTVSEDGVVTAWDESATVAQGTAAASALDRSTGLAAAYRSRTRWNWLN